ncbi:hypothetical protein NHQ30_000621 [Ciborinia camelliae]|nr:hypothetical protein NHQ30_000621 [Ciborinia camelliae]
MRLLLSLTFCLFGAAKLIDNGRNGAFKSIDSLQDFNTGGLKLARDAVLKPFCSGSSASQKIIGYYETWSTERSCDAISPSDLNLAGFTHLNMAFAYFDPSSFTITSMDANMASMLSDFTAVKSTYSGLETWISVGGWSFTDSGSTRKAWSNMASSSTNRAAFIASLIQFMKTYSFDGVDLDWEYPGTSDRGGSTEDGANFVLLLSDMRAAFGQSYGISVTLPASESYLQGFLPVEMEEYVDWFNFMAYDLHGTWDATDIYAGPYIEPHTNSTKISAALDLLWQAGVTPGKVVLGQGWYGRSFTLADPRCTTPNGVCQFKTGGKPGSCTATSGILSNAEIQAIIAENDVTPFYDEVGAVNWITWGEDQWVSYDDSVTYAQKFSFANDLCLGGMMVWAVDLANQSTPTGYGSQADTGLSEKAINYMSQLKDNTEAGIACYTSECGQDCLSGYSGVTNMKGQPGSLPTASECSSGEVETLCCASGTTMGTCTWRGWRGQGLPCSGGCNSGETRVAQNTNHYVTVNGKLQDQTCNGGLQSYCCAGFKAPLSQPVKTNTLDVSENGVEENVISAIIATVTVAIADAAKSVIDAVATDFCEVAVPGFLDVVSGIEAAIPILGEIAIAIEWAEESTIIADCEDLFEDSGDAVLSWAGFTTTLSTDIVETITSTVTSSVKASKRKITAREELRAGPARNLDPRITDTPLPPVLAKRRGLTWGNLDTELIG